MILCHSHLESDASKHTILGHSSHFSGSLSRRSSDSEPPAMDVLAPHDSAGF